jgi:signal transduction histidine kinase
MRRATIRARIALWCATLVTASGAITIFGVLAVTGQVLQNPGSSLQAAPSALTSGPHRSTTTGAAAGSTRPAAPRGTGQSSARVTRHFDRLIGRALTQAKLIGLGVLVALAVLSIRIGWLVADRMLEPVRELASTARQVSESSLDRRIALHGPRDEVKELADSFDVMLDRLDRAFGAQRRFVADAAHELRTPLATIRAEVDAVLDDPAATPEELHAVGPRIVTVLNSSEALVNALLTLSRSDSIVTREPADLAEIARDVVTATPATSRLDLHLDLADAPVRGDPVLLARLAGNLIENGARYNLSGGLLSIHTGTHEGVSLLRVINDGPAIDPAELPVLLERFTRARQRTGPGFGLGLAIADAIARGHGGTLKLEARAEGGLVAVAHLPRPPESVAVPA